MYQLRVVLASNGSTVLWGEFEYEDQAETEGENAVRRGSIASYYIEFVC